MDIVTTIQQYGYAIIFPISIIEGPATAIVAGFLSSLGKLNIAIVFGLLLAGDIVGDTLYYAIGKWGRTTIIKKFSKYLGTSEEKILSFEKYFTAHNWKILAFGKTQPIGGAVLISAGLANTPYLPFMMYNILFSIPKILILELIGYYFGEAIGYTALTSLSIACVLIGVYIALKKFIKVKKAELPL